MTEHQINLLKDALFELERRELQQLKCVKSDSFEPSDRYQNSMDRLLRKEKRIAWQLIRTKKRKLVALLIAALLIFSLTFSISALRDPIIEYAVSVYETFTHFFFAESPDTNQSPITTEYTLTHLPDDYEESLYLKNEGYIQRQWKKGDAYLSFTQSIKAGSSVHLDTEESPVEMLETENQLYYYTKSKGMYFFIWTTDDYAFHFTCGEEIGWENILSILEGIKPMQP